MNSTQRVVVSSDRVDAVAELLKSTPVPVPLEEPTQSNVRRDVLPNLYFTLVAVCHQTSPQGQPALAGKINGSELRGWDYLREAFLLKGERDPDFFSATSLSATTPEQLDEVIQVADTRVFLTDLAGRAELLRDIGCRMTTLGIASIDQLLSQVGGTLMDRTGQSGFLSELSHFKAYRDPVMKKSAYLVALLLNHNLCSVADPHNLPAPVDYHEVRGHLRIGTVTITDQALLSLVASNAEVSEADDIAIRGAVLDAIRQIAVKTKLDQSTLHYLFWNIFRACCARDETHCDRCASTCHLPSRYRFTGDRHCAFSSTCGSRGLENKLVEHRTATDFY